MQYRKTTIRTFLVLEQATVFGRIKSNLGSGYESGYKVTGSEVLFVLQEFIPVSSLHVCETAGVKLLVCPWPAKRLMPQVTVIISPGFLNNTTQMSGAFKISSSKGISPRSVFHTGFFLSFCLFFGLVVFVVVFVLVV